MFDMSSAVKESFKSCFQLDVSRGSTAVDMISMPLPLKLPTRAFCVVGGILPER